MEPTAKITIIVEQGNKKTTIEVPCAEDFMWTDKILDEDIGRDVSETRRELGLTFKPHLKEVEDKKFILYRETVETIH